MRMLYQPDAVPATVAGPADVVRAGKCELPDWPAAPASIPNPAVHGGANDMHNLRITSAYGEVVEDEEVPEREFGAALRRFYNHAMQRANSVVVVDGVMHTRNSFLEFVREFRDCTARRRAHA